MPRITGILVAVMLTLWLAGFAPVARAQSPGENDQIDLVSGRLYQVQQPPTEDVPTPPAVSQPTTQAPGQTPTPSPSRPRGPSAPQPGAQARSFGGVRGPQSSAPSMIGDFFGNSRLLIALQAPGVPINTTTPVFANSQDFANPNFPLQIALDPNATVPLFTTGVPGVDLNGDNFPDSFPVNGVPPQLTPPAPGPGTVTFNQGAVVGQPQIRPGAGNFFPQYNLFLTHTFTPAAILIDAPNPGGGGSVGRVKIAENNSPLPRDRVFHNFSYFDNVPLAAGGVNVNRFIPGFEKTFFGGIASVEVRLPFAASLDSNIIAGGVTNTDHFEFGNVGIPLKVLLFANDSLAWSAGLQVSLPTADDTVVQQPDGTQLLRIQNESTHLMPFIGMLCTPNDRLFIQAFVQVDADTQGSTVAVTNFAGGLVPAGRLDDATFLYADLGIGYWLHRREGGRGLTGIAPTLELHWNRSLDEPSVLQTGNLSISSFSSSVDTTNLVLGTMFECGQDTSLSLAYATPVSGGIDREFDGELRVIFNHRFGPQTRASRAQF